MPHLQLFASTPGLECTTYQAVLKQLLMQVCTLLRLGDEDILLKAA